jgi:hypothetical protein
MRKSKKDCPICSQICSNAGGKKKKVCENFESKPKSKKDLNSDYFIDWLSDLIYVEGSYISENGSEYYKGRVKLAKAIIAKIREQKGELR